MKQSRYDKTAGGLGGSRLFPGTQLGAGVAGPAGRWVGDVTDRGRGGGLEPLVILSPTLEGQTSLCPPLPQAKLKSFSAKIVQLLKEWTEAFPYDFQDEKAMVELKAITHRVTQCDEVRSSLLEPWQNSLGLCPREGLLSQESESSGTALLSLPQEECCVAPFCPSKPPKKTAQLASNRPDWPWAPSASGRPCGPSGGLE